MNGSDGAGGRVARIPSDGTTRYRRLRCGTAQAGEARWRVRDGAVVRAGDAVARTAGSDHASRHSKRTSSGVAPSRTGMSDVPMPRETYIGGPASRYQPAT